MEIITKEAFRAVGIKVAAPFDQLYTKVPKAWKKLRNRLDEITHRTSDSMMEISMKVEEGIYTELIGVEVESEGMTPQGMHEVSIPGQSYIYFHHTGSLKDIAHSFGKMYEWAGENGYEAGDFKIDYGYSRDGSVTDHDLYVKSNHSPNAIDP